MVAIIADPELSSLLCEIATELIPLRLAIDFVKHAPCLISLCFRPTAGATVRAPPFVAEYAHGQGPIGHLADSFRAQSNIACAHTRFRGHRYVKRVNRSESALSSNSATCSTKFGTVDQDYWDHCDCVWNHLDCMDVRRRVRRAKF